MTRVAFAGLLCVSLWASEPYSDRTYPSKVVAGPRNYRVFLSESYATSGRHYPVIYYFNGHSDRYTLEAYDKGLETVPKIANSFATMTGSWLPPMVMWLGTISASTADRPYDVRIDGGDCDFGEGFLELVSHIDSTYRTLTRQRYRNSALILECRD